MFLKLLPTLQEDEGNYTTVIGQYDFGFWSSAVGTRIVEFKVEQDDHVHMTINIFRNIRRMKPMSKFQKQYLR